MGGRVSKPKLRAAWRTPLASWLAIPGGDDVAHAVRALGQGLHGQGGQLVRAEVGILTAPDLRTQNPEGRLHP
jgi:hypothetical protein